MREIERAILKLKRIKEVVECSSRYMLSDQEVMRVIKAQGDSFYDDVFKILTSELDRERNPKTCDGCIHLPQKYNGSLVCENCSRGTILPDRYEPKGEAT